MIDLHCHILPGVDDGATSMDMSLAIARFCAADGITHVFATPHCHRYVHLLRADILPRVAELNRELHSAEIPVTVLPGSEIQVTDTTEYRREFEAGLFCHLGDGREFTLLEFNWARELFPADAVELIDWIRGRGMTPILAHPERHQYFEKEPELLPSLIAAGAWAQVTVDSLIGNHGSAPEASGKRILETHNEVVLSTDAHTMTRCSGMSVGYRWVTDHFGLDRSDDLQARARRVLPQSDVSPAGSGNE